MRAQPDRRTGVGHRATPPPSPNIVEAHRSAARIGEGESAGIAIPEVLAQGVDQELGKRNRAGLMRLRGRIDHLPVDGGDAAVHAHPTMYQTSEYVGRPRRWATGIELAEEPVLDDDGNPVIEYGEPVTTEVNPIPEGSRMAVSENEQAKFGQLAAADLGGYEASVRVLLCQIQAFSTLPSHYLGVMNDQPPSADALRAAEASLTARAEARQAVFGRSWEQVAKLMLAVGTGRDPNLIDDVRVIWADAATRSVAQEAAATVKLYQAGLLPASYALGKLGYSDDEIEKINAARRAESAATQPITEQGGIGNAA